MHGGKKRMIKITGIRFQQDGKMIYYSASGFEPKVGEYVIVQTDQGMELGEVLLGVHEVPDDRFQAPLPAIVRIATEQDILQATENRQREKEAYSACQKKIIEHGLEMKLVSAECTFDRSKMLFYFTANGRIDFRALVKDLASTFKTRIELRQIGVRDEARMLGGLGPCGRPICCGAFLKDFEPVSIKMAKEQNLSLNPSKISGVCGRLMCCLKYEQDQYESIRKKMPRIGRTVTTPEGRGTVTDLNMIKETVSVRMEGDDSSEIKTFTLEELLSAAEKASAEKREDDGAGLSTRNNVRPAEEAASGESEGDDSASQRNDMTSEKQKNASSIKPDNLEGGSVQEGVKNPERNRRANPNDKKRKPERAGENNSNRESGPSDHAEKKAKGEGRKNPVKGNKRSAVSQSEKQEEKANESRVYGKPVRRENPDRVKAESEQAKSSYEAAADPMKKEAGEQGAISRSEPAAPSAKGQEKKQNTKSSGWADALEKAMQAAEQ